jgi:hypothetical protein
MLRLKATLTVEEMRAYVMQAFSPEQVTLAVDYALDQAVNEFPAMVQQEMEKAMRELAKNAVRSAIEPWGMSDAMGKMQPQLMRLASAAFNSSADLIEKRQQEEKP